MPYPLAANRAVAAGSGDVVVTMNNDVDARPDFLERLVAPMEADPGVGSVAALLLRPGRTRSTARASSPTARLRRFRAGRVTTPPGCAATPRR